RTPARRGHPGLRRDIGECAVAIVVIKDAARVLSYVEIRNAITVVIAHRDSHAVSVSSYSGFFRYVGESSIPVVVVEGIAHVLLWAVEVTGPAVHQIDVHPSVVVVVKKSAAGAHGFRLIHIGRKPCYMGPGDAAARRRNLLKGRYYVRSLRIPTSDL